VALLKLFRPVALVFVFAMASVLACPRPLPPAPPVPPADPSQDGGAGGCAQACARLRELGCAAARPTPRGASCVEVCGNVESSGQVSWGPSCVVRSNSCAEASECQTFSP
jgi:hypothetical protein